MRRHVVAWPWWLWCLGFLFFATLTVGWIITYWWVIGIVVGLLMTLPYLTDRARRRRRP